MPELTFVPGALIGTFHYAKLAMYQDLVDNAELYAANDLVAALAGDSPAIEAIRRPAGDVDAGPAEPDGPGRRVPRPRRRPVAEPRINAAVAGRNLVVQGPPGTGKSQPSATSSARLAARGQSVLFVAEKRAAIDAVVGRLAAAGLADLHS